MKACASCLHWHRIPGTDHTGDCTAHSYQTLASNACPEWQQHRPDSLDRPPLNFRGWLELGCYAALPWLIAAIAVALFMWGAVEMLKWSKP